MPDEVTPETETGAPAQGAEAATPEGPKYVTSDDLRSFRDGFAADMRRLVEGIAKPRGSKAPEQAAAPQADYQSAIRREREISEAFEDVGGLPRGARSILRKLVDAEKPENVADFIATHAKEFVVKPSDPAKPTTQARPTASGPSVSDAGGPAASSAQIDDGTPLIHMKHEDRAHLIRTKGQHWYATTLRQQLKGTRVSLKRP